MLTLGQHFHDFLSFWDALPRTLHPFLPAKADITPANCGKLLPHMGIGRYNAPGNIYVLFYGTLLEKATGIAPTGKNFFDTLPPESHEAIKLFHSIIFERMCAAYVVYLIASSDKLYYSYRTLQLPAVDEEGIPRYLIIYGTALQPEHNYNKRAFMGMDQKNVKEMHYIDLGNGAPTFKIEKYTLHKE
ncbi:PAS domain-containing protein [Kordiimonas pumila]|uniref:PAS domain-containing protein n=1 Tax=Kordiimonas pumila TaxID=2161677 RepID=A0ABV7D895_9PROT|nr:PAS domain-containing protein [Kordiimonas pumila]